MTRRLASVILSSGCAVLASACATKSFVQEQVSATAAMLTQRVDVQETKLHVQETKLRETSDRAAASRQAVDAADQRLNGLDMRVDEVGSRASDAKTRADVAAEAAHGAEARLSQRLADRNKYREVETRSIYFAPDQARIRDDGISELKNVADALQADANAVLELQGFADPQGGDRYNYELTRERVEAVVRYLVQHHGIELRQMRAVAMGKVTLAPGEKASPETFAGIRRVDMRLLAPWSSWEDAQIQGPPIGPAQTGSVTRRTPREAAEPPTEAPTAVQPPEPTQATQVATEVPPAQPGAAPSTSAVPNHPAATKTIDVPRREPLAPTSVTLTPVADAGAAASKARPPSPGSDGDEVRGDFAESALPRFLKSVSPGDFGGKE